MTQSQTIVCEYCETINPRDGSLESTCLACGGHLTRPKFCSDIKPKVTIVKSTEKSKQLHRDDLKKAAENADDLYFMVFNTYAIAWRTLGEAISIALTGFILGFFGGVTGIVFQGVIGALIVGLAVGFTRKQFLFVLIGAPAGLLLGLGLGALGWVLGSGPRIMVYAGILFAVIGAAIGGRHSLHFRQRNCWEKTRPLLGAFGGFSFGMQGALLGWGIREAIEAVLVLG